MTFTRKSANLTPIVDTVFGVARKAGKDIAENGPENVVNATIGSLFGEDGKIVAYDTVFNHYDAIAHRVKAAYASSFLGNPTYREAVWNWATQGAELKLEHSVVATPGGTGAVSMSFKTFMDIGQTVILPDIAWESYTLMAEENGLNYAFYKMFDGDRLNAESVKETVRSVMEKQDKILIIFNDPCHNPTGYSMTIDEWKDMVAFFNEVSKTHPVIIVDDMAYIDYSNHLADSRKYMETWNDISDNILVQVCFSCSKTLTSYGLRCGAAILLAQKHEGVREAEMMMEKWARAIWSNVPNAAMENFTWITTEGREDFMKEKQAYVDLMKQRSDTFLSEAAACGLELYPYKEGFFVTVAVEDNDKRDKVHEELMENHIYTVKVNHGIRVAVCSLPVAKVKGLAEKILAAEEKF